MWIHFMTELGNVSSAFDYQKIYFIAILFEIVINVFGYGNVLSGSDDTTIKKRDAITGECVSTLNGYSGDIFLVDANSSIICSSSWDARIKCNTTSRALTNILCH
mmetsp:Transcript_33549/g.33795  ORF Transcript_33549/g.33795 Transcript_33549/m.33795 type:complete len:105 (-) Transcript_33549:260-574(-)